jgi:putative transposase
VLLQLAYLGVTNAFAMLRLLPMSNWDKDVEILALRHQITVLERQLGKQNVRFDASDRAVLAALLHRLPWDVLRRLKLLVRPDTVLRWHRDLLARRHAHMSRPKRPGRPRTVHSIRALVLRLARENPGWGYRRLHGELLVLGIKVAASTVWEILQEAGIDPAPERASSTWADFLRSQADALLACDFLRDGHPDRSAVVRARGDRARQPPGPGPGRHRAPDRHVGGASGEEPRHGPRRRRLPGQVHDP